MYEHQHHAHYPAAPALGVEKDPVCGMALEPVALTTEAGEGHELLNMKQRFSVAAALTVPGVVLAMGDLIPGLGPAMAHALPHKISAFIQLVLATPSYYGQVPCSSCAAGIRFCGTA